MARYLYSGTFAQFATGLPAAGVPFTVWTDIQAGSNVTGQLVGVDGVSAYSAVTSGQGNVLPFRGPDGYASALFVSTGGEIRYALTSPTSFDDLKARVDAIISNPGGGITDHGALSGLGDDDHPQYLTPARGDGRYFTQAQVNAAISAAVATASAQDRNRANHSGTQLSSTISDFNFAVQSLVGSGGGGGSSDWTAITNKPATFPPSSHTHIASEVSDSTTVGRALIRAADAATARAAIGAGTGSGTSNLALGSTSTTAAPGNHGHTASAITFAPSGTLTATDVQAAIQQAASSTASGKAISGTRTASDTALTDAQAVSLYGEGAYFTEDDITQIRSPGSSVNVTTLLSDAISTGRSIELGEGTFLVSGPLPALSANQRITGKGSATILRVASSWTGTNLLTLSGKGCTVSNMQIIGGTATSTCLTNPAIGAAVSLNTTNFATVRDVDFTGVNGWCIEGVATNGLFANQFHNLRGNYNGGGVHLVGASGSSYGVQNMISNVNMQVFQLYSQFLFEDCNDVQIMNVNGCVSGLVFGAHGLHVKGVSSSIIVHNFDVGSYPAVPGISPIIMVEGSPNNIQITGGIIQGGANGIQVKGGSNILLNGVQISRSASAGALISGGDNIKITGCVFARNGYTAPRIVTDAVVTNGSLTVTSTSAAFTNADLYSVVSGTGIIDGSYITAVNSATSVTLSAVPNTTGTGVSLTIGINSEVQFTTSNANVDLSGNFFETPVGSATQQVPKIIRSASSTNATIFRNNQILGGHVKADVFTGGSPKFVTDNFGYNPYGWYTASTKPVPASGSNTSGSAVNLVWYITAGSSSCTITPKNMSGTNPDLPIVIAAGTQLAVQQPAGSVLGFSYTGTAGSATAPTVAVMGM